MCLNSLKVCNFNDNDSKSISSLAVSGSIDLNKRIIFISSSFGGEYRALAERAFYG